MATGCLAAYRARSPRATPLYRLIDAHYDEVKGQWEERFERQCGFWRSFVDEQVGRYLDCGLYENGFARIRCPDCAEEYLLAFSCKTRELIGLVGIERYGVKVTELAAEMGKSRGGVSHWYRRGAARRAEDADFAAAAEAFDRAVCEES